MADIVFVEPKGSFNAYGYFRLPLMGSLILGTILKEACHEVSVLRDSVVDVLKGGKVHRKLVQADVVALSVMTSSAPRAYQIADRVREANPTAKIIMGGSHVTYMAEEAINHADLVVKGEGEGIILDAVDNNGKVVGIVQGPSVENLNIIPDFSILNDGGGKPRITPISTSRGCPYDCVFCTVSSTFGRKYRFRDPQNVLEEMQRRISEFGGSCNFFFYDDNFAASKGRAKKLVAGMQKLQGNFRWSAEARVDVARDSELLKLMARSHCASMLIGFESANQESLDAYDKRQTIQDIENCVKRLHAYGISVHGMFALGSDEDDAETIRQTVPFCHQTGMDYAQFALLHPLPGSRLYKMLEEEGRIFTKDWSLYDGSHVVFEPKKMHPLALQQAYFQAWKAFYKGLRKPHFYAVCLYVINRWHRANKGALADLKRRFGPVN